MDAWTTALWSGRFGWSYRYQTASAFPALSNEICGSSASWPAADSVTGACHGPAGGRKEAWTLMSAPASRVHIAIALPELSKATLGWDAVSPGAESVSTGPRLPAVSRRRAWTR
jgi:hypothetical protein